MANNDLEIEIKFPLTNASEVKIFLNKYAKLISENIPQKDSYYTPFHRDFLAPKYPYEWIRLRQSQKGMFITYKHYFPQNSKKTDYCDEFETKVDNIKSLEKIFKSLDFKQITVVNKTRTTWLFEEVEVVIDEVRNLGFFIELEATKNFKNPKDGKEYLYQILKKINAKVGDEDLRGYPYKLLEKQGYKFGE